MFALARFAILIAQLYVGFSIVGIGLMTILMGFMSGPMAFVMVPVGLGVLWVAYKIVEAMERVREHLKAGG